MALANFGCASNASGDQTGDQIDQTQKVAATNSANDTAAARRRSDKEAAGGIVFKGAVSSTSRFEMILRRAENGEIAGSYFYLKSGAANALELTGKIDGASKFELRETDQNGKHTGVFTGTWTTDKNAPGSFLEGEWRKPGVKTAQFFSASEQLVSLPASVKIVNRRIEETNKIKRFEIEAEYPEIVSAEANSKYAGFNRAIKNLVVESVNQFRKESLAATAEDLRAAPAEAVNVHSVGCDFVFANDRLISVAVLFYEYGAGAAHGNSTTTTVNYDLDNERELKLQDLFKPGANFLEPISAFAIKDLQSRTEPESGANLGLAQDTFADGADASAENYNAWNLTAKGLMFTFDQYQVGPYASGVQTVIVPFAKLGDLLRTDGAISRIQAAR